MSLEVITKTIFIDGMTCVNCENKIEQTLKKIEGIREVKVSYKNGTADVSYDPDTVNLDSIEKIIEELDYHIKRREEGSSKKTEITNVFAAAGILISLFVLMNRFGVSRIFNAFPIAKEGMGYGMLFIVGLLTSVHCVAMCGGICLSQCVSGRTEDSGKSKWNTLRPSILYNMGRVISYTIIGGIVGALGSVISFSGFMKGIVQLLAGIFMVIMGINMLNLFPWLRKFNLRMPKIFARKIYEGKSSNSPFYVGLLNGLMPCGPLQAMQLYALSTGSPFQGALSMFLFSIGTFPLMLVFGAVSSLLNKKFTAKMMSVSAVLVIILGVFMFQNGIGLSGLVMPSIAGSSDANVNGAASNAAEIEEGIQTITTKLSPRGYEPITVQKGIPVKWTIKAEAGDINGCNYSIVVPEYDLKVELKEGDNLIEFTPDESGTFAYSCWMGMIRSKIRVVDSAEDMTSEETEKPSGYRIPVDEVAVAEIENGTQYVTINLNEKQFSPAVVVMERR